MNEDISKNTLLVLVVLTIIISLLGTWTVISETNNINGIRAPASYDSSSANAVGKLSVNIAQQEPVGVTGQVFINIVKEE